MNPLKRLVYDDMISNLRDIYKNEESITSGNPVVILSDIRNLIDALEDCLYDIPLKVINTNDR